MLTLFGKKKITAETVANMYVNAILDTVEEGFSEVAALINGDPEFRYPPQVDENDHKEFLMIVIAGNLKFVPQYFESGEDKRLQSLIVRKFSEALGVEKARLEEMIEARQSFISRVNHPSKKTLYGMSKAVFHKYELNPYQQNYFKSLNTPNPIFLKRLDEVMKNFVWGWDEVLEKYKITF